ECRLVQRLLPSAFCLLPFGFLFPPLRVQLADTEDSMRRKPKIIPVRSTLLSVVLILSAVLFIALALVSCKSESDPRRKVAELRPPRKAGRAEPPRPGAPPPPASVAVSAGMKRAEPVAGGVEGSVAGGVAGGVVGGLIAPAPIPKVEEQLADRDFNTE